MNLNERISAIKERVKALTVHFPYDEETINYLTLAYLAIVLLDPTIEDLVEEAIFSTYIHLTNNSVYEEVKKLLPNHYKEFEEALKTSDGVYEGYRTVDDEIIKEPFIVISKSGMDTNNLLDIILHELKHAINDIFVVAYKNAFYNGITFIYKKKKVGENLDEAFNSYLSCLYVRILTSLKKYPITDPAILEIIASLSENDIYAYSYGNLAESCYYFFKSKIGFWALYNAAIYKDMDPLIDAVDYAFDGLTSFDDLVDTLDWEIPEELETIEEMLKLERVKEEMRLPKI